MKKKKTEKNNTIKNYMYIIKLLLKISPARVYATIFTTLINYFTGVFFSIIFIRYIFNSFETKTFKDSAVFVIISMVVFMSLSIYSSWYNRKYRPRSDQEIYYKLNKLIFEKASGVDIACFENPQFFNDFTSSISDANGRAISILDNTANIFSVFVSSIFVIYTMITLDVFSVFFIIIPVISSFVFNRLANKKRYESYLENIINDRKKGYTGRTVLLKKYAKEIRLSNILKVLLNTYSDGYNGVQENIKKFGGKIFGYSFARSFLSFPIAFETVWLYAAYRAIVTKSISMGEYVVLAGAIVSVTNMLLGLVNSIIDATQNSLYVNKLKEFMNYVPKIPEDQEGIHVKQGAHIFEFINVCFKYDGHDQYAIKNINMMIKSNEVITLVGVNGAGKTTLIKLIMRLYDVTEGEILLDGVNIKEYNIKEYRSLFSTVFQNYQIMAMSVAENVLMNSVLDDKQREICINALKESGINKKIELLTNGIDTVMTKEFDDDGAVLSGGESQKLAIARAYAKDASILILDEPSSSLDPLAEHDIYMSLSKICSNSMDNKLAILISHRMSFANLADKIFLINDGILAEEGTHDVLIKMDGIYADLYKKQAENYIDIEVSAG